MSVGMRGQRPKVEHAAETLPPIREIHERTGRAAPKQIVRANSLHERISRGDRCVEPWNAYGVRYAIEAAEIGSPDHPVRFRSIEPLDHDVLCLERRHIVQTDVVGWLSSERDVKEGLVAHHVERRLGTRSGRANELLEPGD